MTIRSAAFSLTLLTTSALAALTGCSKGGDQQQGIARADTLLQQHKVPEAVAEYQKVVATNAKDPQANARLGGAQLRLGQLTQGYHYLLNARSLEPKNADVRLDLATFYMITARYDEAREQALSVLDVDPRNVRALRLYAASATTKDDQAQAVKTLEAAKEKIAKDTAAQLALVNLYLRKGDTATANRERGSVSDFSPAPPEARVGRALDYVSVGRREDAKRILREVPPGDANSSSASRMLAALTLADGNVDEASKALSAALAKEANDVDAIVARGQMLLLQKQASEAMRDFRAVAGHGTELAPVHYDLAVAYMQSANGAKTREAIDSALKSANQELQTALKLAPGYPDATLQLAALRTQGGAASDAVADIEKFIDDNPRSVRARTILGSALIAAGRLPEADEAFRDVLRISPSNGEAHYWLGMMLLKADNRPGAMAQLDTAATLSPGLFEAINQLASLMVADRNIDGATARVKKQIDVAPAATTGLLYNLLGMISMTRGDAPAAEAAFLKAAQSDPRLVDPHLRLAEIGMATGKYDDAVSQANDALKLNPADTRALMLAGTAYQQKGDVAKARDQYEKLLKINPRDGGAANNLAVLLSEKAGDLDGALKYATLASQLAPADPHVSDTLGWILYQRRSYAEAAKLLKGSAGQLPDSPTVNYHLGMVSQQMGDLVAAKQALTKAVSSPANFAGKDEARRVLAQLK